MIKIDSSTIQTVVVCLAWYSISSVGSQVTKEILRQCPMPLFLGEFQFLFTGLMAVATSTLAFYNPMFLAFFPKGTFPEHYDKKSVSASSKNYLITRPTKHIVTTVLPLGIFQFIGKYFGHKATALVPVSTVSSIKTLSPLFIILVQKMFKYPCTVTINTLVSLFCIIAGVYFIVSFDSSNMKNVSIAKNHTEPVGENLKFTSGIIAATLSMLVFVFQNIYGKSVFTYEQNNKPKKEDRNGELPVYQESQVKSKSSMLNHKKYDKMTLMVYISAFGFCSSFLWFVTLELPLFLKPKSFNNMVTDPIQVPWKLFFINGTLHYIQAMIAYYLLGQISTLSYSIANLMKRIIIIVFSWMISTSSSFAFIQFLGIFLNALGLFMYNRNK